MAGFTKQQQSKISLFLEIAQGQTSATARHFLKAKRWDVGEALQLFYSDFSTAEEAVVVNVNVVDEEDDEENMILENEDQEKETETPAKDFNSLFRPPFGLMFRGSFEGARKAAKLQNKWLMVNLQDEREFSSHTLNRDTWRDKAVIEIIKNNFVFWQENIRTEKGSEVCKYYELDLFPAILVIEPITGWLLQILVGMVPPEILVEKILNFMDSNPKPNRSHWNNLSDEEPTPEWPFSPGGVKSEDGEGPPEKQKPEVDDPKLSCRVGVRLPGGQEDPDPEKGRPFGSDSVAVVALSFKA